MIRDKRSALREQIEQLHRAVDLADRRLDQQLCAQAHSLLSRVDERFSIAGDNTVIALGGATGSGKSSLFNAIVGKPLASAGIRRPTTSQTMAAYWADEEPTALLEWLGVSHRHSLSLSGSSLDGLVLLDLPDHDSTRQAHRAEVNRLISLVDVFIWVVDPQKYADAALHRDYLRPLARQARNTIIAFNQIDRLNEVDRQAAVNHLRALLDEDGLNDSPIYALSAVNGDGVDQLMKKIELIVHEKYASAQRFSEDIVYLARQIDDALGDHEVAQHISAHDRKDLYEALYHVAHVPTVVEACERSVRQRGRAATGWPMTAWVNRMRVNPLQVLHLSKICSRRDDMPQPLEISRTSLRPNEVSMAKVDAAWRQIIDRYCRHLPYTWKDYVNTISSDVRSLSPDQLDHIVASTDFAPALKRRWWMIVTFMQWLIFIAALIGALWLVADVILAYLQLPKIPHVYVGLLPLPTVLLIGGVALGIVVALLCRWGVEIDASISSRQIKRHLHKQIATYADRELIVLIDKELERFHQVRSIVKKIA